LRLTNPKPTHKTNIFSITRNVKSTHPFTSSFFLKKISHIEKR
jgi:hypothetical protein